MGLARSALSIAQGDLELLTGWDAGYMLWVGQIARAIASKSFRANPRLKV